MEGMTEVLSFAPRFFFPFHVSLYGARRSNEAA